MKKELYKIIFLLLCVPALVNGQTLQRLEHAFKAHQEDRLKENIFVHTDKSAYLATEMLWLKVYCADGQDRAPMDISKVAYIDILDAQNRPVKQIKIALDGGFGSGAIYLPASLTSGNYTLRAYTNWMKNFEAAYYFAKTIAIINPGIAATVPEPKGVAPDIQFFPEGGTLINGVESKVACKVSGTDGLGLPYQAAIVNSRGDTLARFNSQAFGMAAFVLKVNINEQYNCIFTMEGGKITRSLPKVTMQGYAVHIKDTTGSAIALRIYGNKHPGENMYLIVHNGQQIRQAMQLPAATGGSTISIEKARLGPGINHLTLFNAEGLPVSGRMYFHPVGRLLHLNAATDQKVYRNRQRVEVHISSEDENKQPQESNLSMSVYKMSPFQKEDQGSILSYLWLQSELKGTIEQPDYYFNDQTAGTIAALDNLMLINGWRKYPWDEALAGKPPVLKFLPEMEGHLVAGRVARPDGAPLYKNRVFFSVPGTEPKLFNAETNADGQFLINVKNLYGRNEVVLQAGGQDTSSTIALDNAFSDQYSKRNTPFFRPDMLNLAELSHWDIDNQVQNYYYGARLRQTFKPELDTLSFYVNPTKRYLMEDYVSFPTMHEVFREFISQIYMVRESGRTRLRVASPNGLFSSDPLMVLNGVPIFNTQKLMAIDPRKLKSMEIVNYRYYLNKRLEDGILNIATYKKDMAGYEIESNALILDYDGLELRTEFYTPLYDTPSSLESKMPDRRSVLSWVPELLTDGKGKTSRAFYIADQAGTYIGVVQGLTKQGRCGYTTFKFDVK